MSDISRMRHLAGLLPLNEAATPSKSDKQEYAEMRIAELKKGGTKFPISEMSEAFFTEIVTHAYSHGWMDGVASTYKK